jgi:polynucleotide 5'-hydroxyl-kinase GRC3/NOL9
MSEDGPAESVDALREATNRDFTTLPSQPSELTFRTAAELREMQAMSYFHIRQSDGRVHWVDQPLSHLKPSVLAYSGQNRISGVLCYDYQAPSSLLFGSINGMVLALVGIENPAAFGKLLSDRDSKLPQVEETPEGIPYISNPNDAALDPQYSKLLGLVLIRGIDTEKRCLLGLSPMLSGNMDAMNAYAGDIVLVHGNFGCPNWAYTESLYYSQFEEDPTGPDVTPDRDSQDASSVPWVEILEGNQSRPVGSRRWRVRRDLGRGG